MIDSHVIDDCLDVAGGLLLTCGVLWLFLTVWPTERPGLEDDR